jgi:RNA polymerase sigma factor (sigma-70 family)
MPTTPPLECVVRQLRYHAVFQGEDFSDGQLLDRFLSHHDEAAFTALVRRHGPIVLGVCQRVLRNHHDVEDAFQATFLVLVRKATAIVPRENVANWLFGVAYRTALKARMVMAKRCEKERRMRGQPARPTNEEQVWEDVLPYLDQELDGLPERYRMPIVLCDLEGKTRREAARQLGWPEGTVAGRLARGRRLLAQRLARHGVAVSGSVLAVVVVNRAAAVSLPGALVPATVKTASAFLTGSPAAGAVAVNVAALSTGVLRAMLISKLKVTFALVLAAGLLAGAAGYFAVQRAAGQPPAPEAKRAGEAPAPENGPVAKEAADTARADSTVRLGSTNLRHADKILFLAYVSGGKQLLSASRDQTIRLWDAALGREVRRFDWPAAARAAGEAGPIEQALQKALQAPGVMPNGMIGLVGDGALGQGRDFQVAVSPNGKYVAALKRGTVYVWETASGKLTRELQPAGALANGVGNFTVVVSGNGGGGNLTFSPDGKGLLLAEASGVTVWDLATGQTSRRIPGAAFDLTRLPTANMVSPDGKYLAWQEYQLQQQTATIKVKDLITDTELAKLPTTPGAVQHLRFTADGKSLVWRTFNSGIQFFEIGKDKEPRAVGQGQGPVRGTGSYCLAADGKMLAMTTGDQNIGIWDVASGKELRHIGEAAPRQAGQGLLVIAMGTGGSSPVDMAFSPDGKRLAVSLGGPAVRQFEVDSGKEVLLPEAGHQRPVSTIRPASDGGTFTTCAAGDSVRVWDPGVGKEVKSLKLPAHSPCATLSEDGRWATSAAANLVEVREVATGQQLHQIATGDEPLAALALSADKKTLATRDAHDGRIRLWDVATARELCTLAEDPVQGTNPVGVAFAELTGVLTGDLAFSPDGTLLAAADANRRLCLWQVPGGSRVWQASPPEGVVERLCFSCDGRSLAALHQDGNVSLIETATGMKRARLRQPRPRQSGNRMAVTVAGRPFTLFPEHGDQPLALAFSPNGRFLATARDDSGVRLWDVLAVKEAARFKSEQGGVTSLAFTPDGRRLIAGGMDTTTVVWGATLPTSVEAADAGQLDDRTLAGLWADLNGGNAAKAFDALRALLRHPGQAATLAGKTLKPAATPDPERVAKLLDDLNSNRFDVRQKATRELEAFGDVVGPELARRLDSDLPLEVRQRLESLRKRIAQAPTRGSLVGELRVIELLELLATPQSRGVLEGVARGAPGARLTAEARASLQRLASPSH